MSESAGILIAPCGIYCGACIAYLREKNRCLGCRIDITTKAKHCLQCKIYNCEFLTQRKHGFCYNCKKFPCQRLKQLDKRYQVKYNTSLIQNLMLIKETNIHEFLENEKKKRICPNCGKIISIHVNSCNCNLS